VRLKSGIERDRGTVARWDSGREQVGRPVGGRERDEGEEEW